MEPQPTPVELPVHLRIADYYRLQIEHGDLVPGDSLPTIEELTQLWNCSPTPARTAIRLLAEQGLISGGRGKPPIVRVPTQKVCRSSDRHQEEKDLVLEPEEVRAATGAAETDLGVPLHEVDFHTAYDQVDAPADLAKIFDVSPGTPLLRRVYGMTNPRTKTRLAWSVSHIPVSLLEKNPALLDKSCEPWPGGTQHQLYTVGIEIERMRDLVTASMPTTAEARIWNLEPGVPMLHVRRISIDTNGRIVETSDADYPADRTELSFTTPLTPFRVNSSK